VDPKEDGALLAERPGASFQEIDELGPLLTEARERGSVTFEELAQCLEEVDVTKEQLRDLRLHLLEQNIDLLAQDGKPAVWQDAAAENGSRKDPDGAEPAKKI
jgi:hypothetical protein